MSTETPEIGVRRRPTHIDGVEVIEVGLAMVPHPAPTQNGRMIELEGAGTALLADGREVVFCQDCDKIAGTATSMRSHRNITHHRVAPPGPRTPEKSIRAVIRAVETARAGKVKGYCEAAAATLNAAGVPNAKGTLWTSTSVSQIYNTYREQYPVRVRRQGEPKSNPALPVVPTPIVGEVINGGSPDELTPQALRGLAEALVLAARQLAAAAERLDAPAVDPELVEKAAKYDRLRGLLG